MTRIDFDSDPQALRYFQDLKSDRERFEHLWMVMHKLAELGNAMIERQDHTNGTVDSTKRELDTHLGDHQREAIEVDFVKRWGGRGTGFLGLLIAASTFILAVDGRIWGWVQVWFRG